MYAVKLIPAETAQVTFNQQTLDRLRQTPFPDGSLVYQALWPDIAGLVIVMNYRHSTLRRWINADYQLGTVQWCHIMFGIVKHLAHAHDQLEIIHGDLKPSNSCPRLD
jgi:serine/threonine protein kinase